MLRKEFYDVPLTAFLFEKPKTVDSIKPEERVRQWCVHELLRAYGYSITDLTFEHPVKVGSKKYRIDILINRSGKPFIVIECKKLDFKQHASGVEQAISYANAPQIKADYAIYTNGSVWLVKRFINGRWASVADIPVNNMSDAEYTVDLLYRDLNDAAPLLHKLVDSLSIKDTHRYFEAMQRFLHGQNLLTLSGNKQLLRALDHLLRCILHFKDNDGYVRQKFFVVIQCITEYAKHVDLEWDYWAPHETEHPFWQTALYQSDILEFLEDTRCEAVGIDYYLLELIAALFGYCHELRGGNQKNFPPLCSDIQDSTRNLLDYGFKLHLQHRVPVRSDKLTHQDIQRACSHGWSSDRFSLSS